MRWGPGWRREAAEKVKRSKEKKDATKSNNNLTTRDPIIFTSPVEKEVVTSTPFDIPANTTRSSVDDIGTLRTTKEKLG
jgi:hypothetical protein